MSKMKLYMILFVISSALGFMILYALQPFDVISKDDADQGARDVEVEVVQQSEDTEMMEVRLKQSKLMRSYMNTSADPCEDFNEYACGNWEEVNPIPKDKWEYSSIERLVDKLELKLKEVLEEPIGDDDPPDAVDKAKIFYRSCIDEGTIEKRGAQPLLDFIEDLGGWPAMEEEWNETNFDWIQLAINLSFVENGVVLAYSIEKNTRTPENIIYLKQPVLGMSNIDYYLKEEHASKLEAYKNLVENVLLELGVNAQKAQATSADIIRFETRLANAKNTPKALKINSLMRWPFRRVEKEYSWVEWDRYFFGMQGTKLVKNQTIGIVYGDAAWYYDKMSFVFADINLMTLANYMIWRSVLLTLPNLSANFRSALNAFNNVLTGQVDPKPMWKQCVHQIISNIGMTVSALFVKRFFDESSKQVANDIITSLKDAFEDGISELDWLGEDTKKYAVKKLRMMKASVGYPDYILSKEALNSQHNQLDVVVGKHFENYINIAKFHRQENLNRFSKPFDPEYWPKPPTMVNALYEAGGNRIIVLAGILQSPTFHRHFPQSLNYGKIGMFLGHEIIHGFDKGGHNYDTDGNIFNWWLKSEKLAFEEKTKCFQEQYDHLSRKDIPFDAMSTISENLADNGGIRLAHRAYHQWLKTNSPPKWTFIETLPDFGLDYHQLFFLGFAQAFCTAIRPEAVQANKHYNHSPMKYRIIGSLQNFDKFSEAFQCPKGSAMNPTEKCKIW